MTPDSSAAQESPPADRENDGATDVDVIAGGGYRFPLRNPHAGAAIALLRPQFGGGVG